MYKFCVFAGTSEGRAITEYLLRQNASVFACVATEYGSVLLPQSDNLTVSAKRLSEDEMIALFNEERFDLVIDATHPYAKLATESISDACVKAGLEYVRIIREGTPYAETVFARSADEAAKLLGEREGNILLTTGSKELASFTGLRDFSERVYARVLPVADSINACAAAGLMPSHIIAMQGPFSEEMNYETLNHCDAKWLVTKDSGNAGGFSQKLFAAERYGAGVIVIGRPFPKEKGLSLFDCFRMIERKYGLTNKPEITIVGIGPGSRQCLTAEAAAAIKKADCVIGAKRMLSLAGQGKPCAEAVSPDDIMAAIEEEHICRNIAVLMSGDTGFFSGTKRLLPRLKDYKVRLIPGISSLSYLCAKLGKSYDDVYLMSLHGREG
ncbi:MAG: precorrin-6A reductase, partial [Firmicutes bacterium]|nr:precorrin-6A reductase [Bacillota bacterium]